VELRLMVVGSRAMVVELLFRLGDVVGCRLPDRSGLELFIAVGVSSCRCVICGSEECRGVARLDAWAIVS
jgi:hypothetical protein